MQYFIKLDGEPLGPFTEAQIRQRLVERAYKESDLVRLEDSEDWVPLGSLKEFADAVGPLPALSNPMALTSLALGSVSLLLLILAMSQQPMADSLPLLPLYWGSGLGGIVLGHLAVRKIGHTFRDVRGYRAARVGLWLSYIAAVILPIVGYLAAPYVNVKGNQPIAISNCRQIILALKIYSSDSGDRYPDLPLARSSNEVFRLLFKEGILNKDSEKLFRSAVSPFEPDNKIGNAPDFAEALRPGENHWALTKGQRDSSPGDMPIVFENPSEATWPPKWNASLSGQAKAGRAWSGGKIIIGFNDCSVALMPLEAAQGESVGLKPLPSGKPVFPMTDPKPVILNVAK